MARRKPAARCVVCEKTIDEIGGVRLVATHRHSIILCTPDVPLGSIRHPARTIRLTGNHRDVIFSMFGEAIWTDEVVERIVEVGMAGLRPWFCQVCADIHLCRVCGSPLTRVPTSDYLEDNGRSIHSPSVSGYAQSCPNSNCQNFRSQNERRR